MFTKFRPTNTNPQDPFVAFMKAFVNASKQGTHGTKPGIHQHRHTGAQTKTVLPKRQPEFIKHLVVRFIDRTLANTAFSMRYAGMRQTKSGTWCALYCVNDRQIACLIGTDMDGKPIVVHAEGGVQKTEFLITV